MNSPVRLSAGDVQDTVPGVPEAARESGPGPIHRRANWLRAVATESQLDEHLFHIDNDKRIRRTSILRVRSSLFRG